MYLELHLHHRFVAEKTTIPVPRVHGYSFQKDSRVGFAFMLIDYIDGTAFSEFDLLSLSESQRAHFCDQLAEFYIQLRNHEFSRIGSLSISNTAAGWTFDTLDRPLSIELNAQELEGLHARDIIKKDTSFGSAKDYFTSLVNLAFNMFEKCKNSVFDEYDAEGALYNLHQFREVVNEWVDSRYSTEPFILYHGDFRPHNIMVDDDLNIIGVIDWEWGHIVPVQLFLPPTWLIGCELGALCKFLEREDYIEELGRFKSMIQRRGEEATSLLQIWKNIEQDDAFLVANALQYPSSIDTVYSGYFDLRRHSSPRLERVDEFLQSDPFHRELVRKKVVDRSLYLEELTLLGLEERDGNTLPINAIQTTSKLGYLTPVFSSSQWRQYICTEHIKDTMFLPSSIVATVGGFIVVTYILHRLFK